MFNKLEVNSAGAVKVNGKPYQIAEGFDARRRLTQLESNKRTAMKSYMEMIEKVKNQGPKPALKKEFDHAYNKLVSVDNDIVALFGMLDDANKEAYENRKHLERCVDDGIHSVQQIAKRQYKKHANAADVKEAVKVLKQIHECYKELSSVAQGANSTFVITGHASAVALPEASPKGPKKKHPRNKSGIPKLSPRDEVDIKNKVKGLVAEVFAFKDRQQCLSRAKAILMKKEQIIAEIEKHPGLKGIMPPRYKSMSKEQLCEFLYP